MGKMGINFQFFWFRFTVYNKEQIFFIDIHVLFQKRPGSKLKERYELTIRKRSELRIIVQGQIYKHIFAQNKSYCVSYPSNILQRA